MVDQHCSAMLKNSVEAEKEQLREHMILSQINKIVEKIRIEIDKTSYTS